MSVLLKLQLIFNQRLLCRPLGGISAITNQQLCTKLNGTSSDIVDHDVMNLKKETGEQENTDKPKRSRLKKWKTYPILHTEQWKSIEDIVAIDLRLDALYWVKISKDLRVQDWTHIELFTRMPAKFDHITFFDMVEEAIEQLPDASVFVMENIEDNLQSLKMRKAYTNAVMFKSMFLAMMTQRSSILTQPSTMERHVDSDVNCDRQSPNYICMMNSHDISKCLNISVGMHRTNVQRKVQSIIAKEELDHNDVDIPWHLVTDYYKVKPKQSYFYANTLLLSIAFIRNLIRHTSS